MSAAIFGLVGVVVGGVLTGVVGWLTERSKERRLARVAARVLREHLLDVMRAGEDEVAGRPAALRPTVEALLAVWRDERRALATVMAYAPYAQVAEGVRAAARAAASAGGASDGLREEVAAVGVAAHALKPLAGRV